MQTLAETLKKAFPVLILALTGFLLYFPSLGFDFVWDDHYLIVENPAVHSFANVPDFFQKDFWENTPLDYASGFYRPVTLLSFMLNHALTGGDPFGFHLTNVLLHIFNALLVFAIFRECAEDGSAYLASAIFLLHPLQTEVVSFISDIGDLLCVFFVLSTIYLYIQSRRKGSVLFLGLSFVTLVLGFFSKENAMITFALVILVDVFFLMKRDFSRLRERLPAWGAYVFATVAYIGWRAFILGGKNAVTTLENVRYVSILPSFDAWTHVLTISKVVFDYFEMFVWPVHQSISYVVLPETNLFSAEVFLSVIALASMVLCAAAACNSRYAWVTFGLVWFFMTIFPVSNLVPISNTVAERFMYLPGIGLCFLAGKTIHLVFLRFQSARYSLTVVRVAVVAVFLCLALKAVASQMKWHSDFTVFRSAVNEKPCSPMAHVNLKAHYNRAGLKEKAKEEHFRYIACREYIKRRYRLLKRQYRKNITL